MRRRRPTTATPGSRSSGGAGTARRRPATAAPPPASPTSGTTPGARWSTRSVRSGCGQSSSAIHAPGQAAGNGSGGAYSWRKTTNAGSSIDAVVDALQPVVEEADHLVVPVEVRARVRRRPGSEWTQLPISERRGRRAALVHPQGRVDVRVHPAADREDRGLDRVVVRARASPAASTARRAAGGAIRRARSASARGGRATRPSRPGRGTRRRAAARSSRPC